VKKKKSKYVSRHFYIVDQLKKARREANLTQATVAKKLGTAQSYISQLESGRMRIDFIYFVELTRIYNKDVDYFLS